ncbi:hypothetical protein QTI33_03695 [Variovorax sp. J22P271]|uniref:hypothetical protein n=1 Tax=Variovorax davisae TaxID=3053515 RepID=UPI0025765C6E|nr:hypothetical protein [Variovorax sp. J22P271]MDM0031238.1 hypothetical protein [Variovorax sp. J22P271]
MSALVWGDSEDDPGAADIVAREMHRNALAMQETARREAAAGRCAEAARAAVLRGDPPEALAAAVVAALDAPFEPPAIYSTGSRSTFGFEPSHR